MKADRKYIYTMLKTARGQVDGIIKMVDDDRYCMEISNQLLATQSILRAVNMKIIEAHMRSCVKEAIEEGNTDEKMDEMFSLFTNMSK